VEKEKLNIGREGARHNHRKDRRRAVMGKAKKEGEGGRG
jgi:hypothetical protein